MIPVNIPNITESDIEAVQLCLKEGWISGDGPVVQAFEESLARSVNRGYGVAVSNGSDALDLALHVLGLKPGDEIILPSFAIISCLAPILRFGLVPVFVDSEPETWNLNAELLPDALSEKTRAILVVHTYGLAADMTKIMEFANFHNLKVIEDSAEAHGLFFNGMPCGSFGDLSTFSFYANKNVTTGEGGMVLTNDPHLNSELRYYRNLTFQDHQRFVHDHLGWNMRLSSIQAALGTSQIKRVKETVIRRRAIAEAYLSEIRDLEGLEFQSPAYQGNENGYWVVGVLLEGHPKFSTAKEAMAALQQVGVGTRPFFYPLHKQPLLKQYGFEASASLPVSEKLGLQGFYLPNGLGMSDEMLEKSVKLTKEVLG